MHVYIGNGGAARGCAGQNGRWDVPAYIGNGGVARECAGQNGRWDVPAYLGNGGAARGCAGQNVTGQHDDGMRRPDKENAAR